MAILALVLALALSPPAKSPGGRNAAADAVVEKGRALGIEFSQTKEQADQPSRESVQAFNRAGVGAWVDAQIQTETEELEEPPAPIREFLQDRRDDLWSVVAALERGEPDWGPYFDSEGSIGVPFLGILRLERVLVAAALVEEYDGNRIEAGRALEAAWSLSRAVSLERLVMTQLIAMAAERMQVGALRKMQEPSLAWLGRLGGEGPWRRMLDAAARDAQFRPRGQDDGSIGASSEVAVKAFTAISESLAKVSPCELADMSDEDLWRPAAAALEGETNPLKRAFRDFYAANGIQSVANALRRAARLEVDREMTLKILQLRLGRDASGEGNWPEKLVDTTSAVCPAASYVYEGTGGGVELRLRDAPGVPEVGPVLPLRFRGRNPEPGPAPAPPALTPTPGGAMIAPP